AGSSTTANGGPNGAARGGAPAPGTPPATAPPQTVRPTIPESAVKTIAGPGDGALPMRVVLLVSNGTAHAAEIFAAALSNNKRATLVGEPTAGLAGTQRLVRLPEGHGLMMTTERYLQSDGVPIHSRGLRPNVIVEIPTIGFEEQKPTTDTVLEAGIKELTSPTPPTSAGASAGSPVVPPGNQSAPLTPGGPALPTVPQSGAPRN
ncbi:MAG: S41 family peptidase, partial [Acidobacteriota bacterium]